MHFLLLIFITILCIILLKLKKKSTMRTRHKKEYFSYIRSLGQGSNIWDCIGQSQNLLIVTIINQGLPVCVILRMLYNNLFLIYIKWFLILAVLLPKIYCIKTNKQKKTFILLQCNCYYSDIFPPVMKYLYLLF